MRRFMATAAAQPMTRIAAGIILKRNPVMLRTPTNFEVAHAQFRNRDQGVPYNASFYESDKTMPRRSSDAEAELPFISRVTDADAKRDEKSMERALDRSLYLVVKKNRSEHAWQFPQGGLEPNESLHEAAERELKEECGDAMNVWFVGRAPVGHYAYAHKKPLKKQQDGNMISQTQVFFMKSQVFSGQVQPDGKEIVDYAWLTKEELATRLDSNYYEAVRDCLADN